METGTKRKAHYTAPVLKVDFYNPYGTMLGSGMLYPEDPFYGEEHRFTANTEPSDVPNPVEGESNEP